MQVFRVSKNRDFTVIANSVFKDRRLSAKAKGILVEMLSLPENRYYTLKGLTTLFSDGIDSIRQGIKELEENGYIMLFATKLGQTWRLADGITVSEKFLHIADGFSKSMQSP